MNRKWIPKFCFQQLTSNGVIYRDSKDNSNFEELFIVVIKISVVNIVILRHLQEELERCLNA